MPKRQGFSFHEGDGEAVTISVSQLEFKFPAITS
jgi:hypothetical protein